jgi:hypothetical protein
LKRTRPRQRFCVVCYCAVFYDEGREVSRGRLLKLIPVILILQYAAIGIDGTVLPDAVAENAGEEGVNAQFIVLADGQFMSHGVFKIPALIREIPYCFCNDFPIPYFE